MQSMIGYAISDISEKFGDLEKALMKLSPRILELQPEKNIWNYKSLSQYDFLAVHAPTVTIDISNLEESTRKRSISKTIESMNLANEIDANAFVIHPVHYEPFMQPEDRLMKRDIFLDTFKNHLVPIYLLNNHKYQITIENIEYSKYPATLEELEELRAACSTMIPTKLTIDIPHIWNSRRILEENKHLKDKIHGYPVTKGVLFEYIEKFIKLNEEKIEYYHVANFGTDPIRTHDTLTNVDPELKKIIKILKRPIILEIYHHSYEEMIKSKEIAEEINNE